MPNVGYLGKWMYENNPHFRSKIDNAIPRSVREWHDRELKYWSSPRGEYELKAFATGLPFGIGDWLKSLMQHNDAMAQMDRTLDIYGLGYEDIKYITNTLGFNTGGALAGRTMNYISSNVGKLYR